MALDTCFALSTRNCLFIKNISHSALVGEVLLIADPKFSITTLPSPAWVAHYQRFATSLKGITRATDESILIEAPRGVRILIDGGGSISGDFDTGSRIVMPFLLSKKILTLDYVINSHSHADHIGGLVSILRHLRVNTFVSTPFLVEYPEHPSLLQMMRQKKTTVQFWKKGETYRLPGETSIAVLYPPQIASFENLNDTSLVIKIIQKSRTFLFPGDIGDGVEEELLESGAPLKADVLKIPHHGSRTSSSFTFLCAVRPELAILSGGGVMQGLPALETLERYHKLSIPVLRTDRQGPITVCSYGGRLTYRVSQR